MANYNPYAAPTAEPSLRAGVPAVGQPQPWTVGEAIRAGWEAYKANWAALSLGYLVVTLIGAVPGQVAPVLVYGGVLEERTMRYYAVHVPLTIVGWLVAEFFTAGFTRAALNATRTGRAAFGDYFGAGGRFLVFVMMSMLRAVATVLGLVLFVVPGVIVSLGFANAPFYVIDQNHGPIESLKASWRSAEGQKSDLFVLTLAELGIILLGLLAGCVGVFVAVPLMMIARAIVYTKMSGTAAAVAEGPPPVGGYGYPFSGAGGYGGYPAPGQLPGQGGPPGYYNPPPGGLGGGGRTS